MPINGYHKVIVHCADETSFETMSTFGSEGSVMRSECDFASHPAWNINSGSMVNEKGADVRKFKSKNKINYSLVAGNNNS